MTPDPTPAAALPDLPPLLLFPAIDLCAGQVVRLAQGDLARATVYHQDPLRQAERFAAQGFSILHVVDLDGATQGRPINQEVVRVLIGAAGLPVQLGGGIRDLETLARWFEIGCARCVLGTMAVEEPELFARACRCWPGRIVAALDTRNSRVTSRGWQQETGLDLRSAALRCQAAGAAAILTTEIGRDGMLQGSDAVGAAALAAALEIPVIASGGVAQVEDLHRLRRLTRKGVTGVIVGRALYDGHLRPEAALAVAGAQDLAQHAVII